VRVFLRSEEKKRDNLKLKEAKEQAKEQAAAEQAAPEQAAEAKPASSAVTTAGGGQVSEQAETQPASATQDESVAPAPQGNEIATTEETDQDGAKKPTDQV